MPKQSNRSQKKKTNNGIITKLSGLKWQVQLFGFAAIFAAISGGYLIYQSFASDLIPKGSNELVLSYEIGMEHGMAPDEFPTAMNPSALLYGNGLLLCSNQHTADHAQAQVGDTGWRYQQLNNGQVQKLVSAVRAAGFKTAADYKNGKDGILAPASAGRYIRLNTTEGVTKASYYPNDGDSAFIKVEGIINAKCAEATTAYESSDVYVDTLVLSNPAAAATAEPLPAELEVDPEPQTPKRKELSGAAAKSLRDKIGKEGKVFQKDGKAVKTRLITKIPEYVEPEPVVESSKGKVSAATANKTRWLIVLGVSQDRPGWASQDQVESYARNTRTWYNREVGETFTVDGMAVVRGKLTRDQYRTCYAWARERGCNTQAEAIYYNLHREFAKPGYSTNVIAAFEPEGSTLGMGSQANSYANDTYTNYYGTLAVTFAGHANTRPAVTRQVAGHEIGHNFGLGHRECGSSTIMAACLSSVRWPDTQLYSGQAAALRRYSTFFE